MNLDDMFPKTIFVEKWKKEYGDKKTFTKQLGVVCDEVLETQEAYSNKDYNHVIEEIVDIFHSTMQLTYLLPKEYINKLEQEISNVREKNERRGYYE